MNSQTNTELEQQIGQAFSHRVYPGDENISHQYGEGADIQAFYRGKRWQDIDFRSPFDGPGFPWSPWFLTPEAFRYYLPAFLVHLLDYPEEPAYGWEILGLLSPPQPGRTYDLANNFLRNTSGLSPSESAAILNILEFLLAKGKHNAMELLEGDIDPMDVVRHGISYWRERLKSGASDR